MATDFKTEDNTLRDLIRWLGENGYADLEITLSKRLTRIRATRGVLGAAPKRPDDIDKAFGVDEDDDYEIPF